MRYSAQISVIAAIFVMVGCFLPWVEIPVLHTTLTGMDPQGTYFGRPGYCSFHYSPNMGKEGQLVFLRIRFRLGPSELHHICQV